VEGKRNIIKSLICIWIAVLGFAFTTLSFYDYNPKLMFIEITEETGEDGGEMDEKDTDTDVSFDPLMDGSKFHLVLHANLITSITTDKAYSTCTGFMLDMIKPPLAN
jgi:hypothetical protein